MSVTIDNALINQSYKAIADISKTASNCISSSLQFEENALKSIDSFELSNSKDIGLYSKDIISSNTNITTDAIDKVQMNSTSAPNDIYLDVIKLRAAKKAGVSLNSSGAPNINSGWAASTYYGEISRINGAFWCQSSNWSNLPDIYQCGRTAAATMASINSGYTVTPNDTTGNSNGLTGIIVNGRTISYNSNATTYDLSAGPSQGIRLYNCGSEDGVTAAINNELANGRSVLVKTTVGGEHWVTVTGTVDGNPANSFDDFVGVDPWYNAGNPNNPSPSTGDGAASSIRAGVITLSDVKNQNLHPDYRIITYKPGTEAAF